MSGETASNQPLTGGAQRIVSAAVEKQIGRGHEYLGINHWLLALLEGHSAMAEAMVSGLSSEQLKNNLAKRLQQNDLGLPLAVERLVAQAEARAVQRSRPVTAERDLAEAILILAGYPINQSAGQHPSENGMMVYLGGETIVTRPLPTPVLDQFGTDLTRVVREGCSTPVVGRDAEIALVIETLCRKTKRNPILVGPAGVGKTAIVEGFAQRVAAGEVPAQLKDARVVALQPSVLIAGAHMAGELEKRMKAVLAEARQPGMILFIDEIHTIMGAGGMLGTTDLGSMLKPALARGDLACIAATTDDEFRRYIENDTALERRFQPLRVNELSPEQTLEVLKHLREELGRESQIHLAEDALLWLVDFARQYMRNRYFPDKAIDLVEQCFAHAAAIGKTSIELADAQDVAQRMVGMPVVTPERLDLLRQDLLDRRLLTEGEVGILINRLQVTLRGLDMRAARPNAILLLTGASIDNSQAIAETVAGSLFGAADRVISIDFSRFSAPEDLNLLVGAPPGYVGYNDRLPLHGLAQTPWCVLHFDRVDTCHPRIREVLAQAFQTGSLVDGRGKTLYLSDVVVVMTAEIRLGGGGRTMGFLAEDKQVDGDDLYQAIVARVGGELADQVDLISFGAAGREGVSPEWLEKHFLANLAERYLKQGVKLTWDETFMNWLGQQQGAQLSEHDWENWVDRSLTPLIIPFLPPAGWKQPVEVVVRFEGESIRVVQKEE